MSIVLLVKLLAAPTLIGLASLAGKRWGPNAAGLMGGLPLVGGPVVLAIWLSDGAALAQQVALAAPAGIWANIVYMLVVAYASARWRWYVVIPLGWICYLATAVLLNAAGLAYSLTLGVAVLPGLWLAATRGLPKPAMSSVSVHLPRIELFTRMAAAALLVLSLTTVSSRIGPSLTGVLAGAPVAAVVIPAFLFANAGRDALLHVLRGFLTGLMGFTVFFLILGNAMPAFGALALIPALTAGVGVGLLATRLSKPELELAPEQNLAP